MFRPSTLLNIYILNSKEDKLFLVKKNKYFTWFLLGEKLQFGEQFEDCAIKIILNETSLVIEKDRLKLICTYNSVHKETKKHFLIINYYIKLTEKEEENIKLNFEIYELSKWLNIEEVMKLEDLFFGIKQFLTFYNIRKIADIKTLFTNS